MDADIITFIGIGSNLDGTVERCREAGARLSLIEGVKLLRTSSWYRTEPVGFCDQDWFINGVVEVRTMLSARELLVALQGIEQAMGRVRGEKWGPRVIDLDILLYGQEVIEEKDLIIPHPELHKRGFTLIPMCELASYTIHPAFGVSMQGLLSRLIDTSKVERL